MSEAITTARPYAQAAFDAAQKLADLKGWSEAILSLAEAVNHPEVQAIINSPRVAQADIESLMDGLLGAKAVVQLRNFVRVLAENKRMQILPEIASLFEALRADAEKTALVEVDSAFELSDKQQENIISSLKKRLGRDIKLACKINKDLLGGVVIRTGDQVIDGSARTRLGEMATALA
ncbi:MAG: ATP synthase F1 subunit delta [Gallionellales bacterium RIFOXYB12_FULL_54_9]|nr:MAG: ATP synthase F1 subunit delta [Gallionellales bacterium RIFOXYB12_FULL_54_9]